MRRRKGPPAQRVRAPFSPTPRSQPLPHELHIPQSAPGCVAHTHNGLPRARGRVGEAASTAATARVWHAFSPRDTHAMPTHAASQLHMAHPAPHMTATETRATPRQPRRPHRAWPAHPGGGVPASLHPLAPAARARIKRAVQGWLSTAASANQLQLQCTTKTTRRPPSARASAPSTALRRGPSGAADPHLHSELRHALHTARTRPLETRTCAGLCPMAPSRTHARCSHRVDA
jgi:hypothetical protein